MSYSDIDTKIKKTFRLFEGIRSEEEDQKIYERVYDLCFEEMTKFLFENLSDEEKDRLAQSLEKENDNEEKTKTLLSFLGKIDNYRFKLDKRLNHFLNNLLISSLNKLKTKD